MLLTHPSVSFYSGEIKSVSDGLRNKLLRVHQRLLRPGNTTKHGLFIDINISYKDLCQPPLLEESWVIKVIDQGQYVLLLIV